MLLVTRNQQCLPGYQLKLPNYLLLEMECAGVVEEGTCDFGEKMLPKSHGCLH